MTVAVTMEATKSESRRKKFEWYNWTRKEAWTTWREKLFLLLFNIFSSFRPFPPSSHTQYNNVIFTLLFFSFHKSKIIRNFCWRWVNTLELAQKKSIPLYMCGNGGKLLMAIFIQAKMRLKWNFLIYIFIFNANKYKKQQ